MTKELTKKELQDLVNDKGTIEAAKILGVAYSTIYKILTKHKISYKKRQGAKHKIIIKD